jgi:hypothetical protein
MQGEQDLVEQVRKALTYMDSLGLDLPIFLHALSWGNDPLISDSMAKYHRGILMNSLELPEIVKQWNKKSEAAQSPLTQWAVDHVTQLINTEMNAAVEKLCCDGDDLTKETFLSITPQSMTLLLKPAVPTLWRVLKSASRTSQQEKQNKEDSKKVQAIHQNGESCMLTLHMTEHVICCLSARFFKEPQRQPIPQIPHNLPERVWVTGQGN